MRQSRVSGAARPSREPSGPHSLRMTLKSIGSAPHHGPAHRSFRRRNPRSPRTPAGQEKGLPQEEVLPLEGRPVPLWPRVGGCRGLSSSSLQRPRSGPGRLLRLGPLPPDPGLGSCSCCSLQWARRAASRLERSPRTRSMGLGINCDQPGRGGPIPHDECHGVRQPMAQRQASHVCRFELRSGSPGSAGRSAPRGSTSAPALRCGGGSGRSGRSRRGGGGRTPRCPAR